MGNNPSTPHNEEKVIKVKSSYTDAEINENIMKLLAQAKDTVPQAVTDTESMVLPDTVAPPQDPTVNEQTQAGGSNKRYRQFVDSMMQTTEDQQVGGADVESPTFSAQSNSRDLSEFSEFRRIKEYVINNAINSTETAAMEGGAKKSKKTKAKKSRKTKTKKAKATKSSRVVSPFSESSLASTSPESQLSSHSGAFSPTSTNVFTTSDMENLSKTSTYNNNANSDSEYNIHPFYSESSDLSSRFPHSKDRF